MPDGEVGMSSSSSPRTYSFDYAWDLYESIQYGFSRDEAAELHRLATIAGPGAIVEVGSMQGGSACIMESAGRDVVCIDPIENPVYYAMFIRNCAGKRISHVRAKDSDVWGWWKQPISLLLIDHDHSFGTTAASLREWRRHLTEDAVVLVHDYGGVDWPEVKPATDQSGLKIVSTTGRLAVGEWR